MTSSELYMSDGQRDIASRYYHIVSDFMDSFSLSENDTPDWHGAACTGLCRAAVDYYYLLKVNDSENSLKLPLFEDFALPYIVVECGLESPRMTVFKKLKPVVDSLSYTQRAKLVSLVESIEDSAPVLEALIYS